MNSRCTENKLTNRKLRKNNNMEQRSESKISLRVRKFSWTKTHSVKNNNHVTLKRSGSMNNIIMGLNKEYQVNGTPDATGNKTEKKRRSSTIRLKKKFKNNNNNNNNDDDDIIVSSNNDHQVISTSASDLTKLALHLNHLNMFVPGVCAGCSLNLSSITTPKVQFY